MYYALYLNHIRLQSVPTIVPGATQGTLQKTVGLGDLVTVLPGGTKLGFLLGLDASSLSYQSSFKVRANAQLRLAKCDAVGLRMCTRHALRLPGHEPRAVQEPRRFEFGLPDHVPVRTAGLLRRECGGDAHRDGHELQYPGVRKIHPGCACSDTLA